jgi:hypothetical protein
VPVPDRLRIVDPDNLAAVKMTLNGLLEGDPEGFKVAGADLGAIPVTLDVLAQPPTPSVIVASATPQPTERTWFLKIEADDYDGKIALVRALGEELLTGGALEWRERHAAESVYFEFLPSPAGDLLRGGEDDHILLEQFVSARGYPVTFLTQPLRRKATITEDIVVVSNDTLGRHRIVPNGGNADQLLSFKLRPHADQFATVIRAARKSTGDVAEFATMYAFDAATAQLFNGAASVADGDAASGNAAEFQPSAAWERYIKKVRNPANPRTFEGVHRVIARIRPTGDGLGEYDLAVHSGELNINPLPDRSEPVHVDFSDITGNPEYIDFELGEIEVGRCDTFAMEVHARSTDGPSELRIAEVFLMPADEQTITVTVPGVLEGTWGHRVFRGDELAGSGAVKGRHYRLNEENEEAHIQPPAGLGLAAGIYIVEVRVNLRNPSRDRIQLGKLEIRENPAGANTLRKMIKLRTRKGALNTEIKRRVRFKVEDAEADGVMKFLPKVTQTAGTANGRRIEIIDIEMHFLQAITHDTAALIDGIHRRFVTIDNATDVERFAMVPEGDIPTSPPRPTIWIFTIGAVTPETGYDDIDERIRSYVSHENAACDLRIKRVERFTH